MTNTTPAQSHKALILAFGFALIGAFFVYADKDEDSKFFLDFDPGSELLTAKYAGGRTNVLHSFILYEDGRLIVQATSHDEKNIYSSRELKVPHAEVEELIIGITDSGLMESSTAHLSQIVSNGKSQTYTAPDSSSMYLEVNLSHYKSPGSSIYRPAAVSIFFTNPMGAELLHPQIDEIQCLALLTRTLKSWQRKAEEK